MSNQPDPDLAESDPPGSSPRESSDPAPRTLWLSGLRAIGRGLALLPRPLWVVAAALWMWGIWELSSRSYPPGPKFFLSGVLNNGGHAFLFGMLGLFVVLAVAPRPVGPRWPDPGPRVRALAIAVVLVWGALDEWHQAWVPARSASAFDLLTDLVGVLSVLGVAAYLGRPDADERGTRRALLLALLASTAVAGLASMEKVLLGN